MSSVECDPEHYDDESGNRAQAMFDEKVKGQQIKAATQALERGNKIVNIMATLKQSFANAEKKWANATAKETPES